MKVRTGQVDIRVREWGKGDPLILAHGLGMSGELWRYQADAFSSRFRTIAVDLRGFGESSRPDAPGSYAIRTLADDIVGVADALGLDRFHFLGTSMGGFVGQALGLAYPERCKSLVLCHTGPRMSIPPDVLAARVEALKTQPLSEYADLVIAQAVSPGASSELKQWVRDMLVRNDKRTYTQVLTEGLSDFDLSARVGEITIPTLVIIGERDGVIPPDQGHELAKRIQGAKSVEIPGVGHLGYAEQPDRFNDAVLRFLETV